MKLKTFGDISGESSAEGSRLSRRRFVRGGAAFGAAGSFLLKTSKSALGKEATPEGVVRCGIIGYGDQGKALRESAVLLKDRVRFPAMMDIWKRNLDAAAGQIAANGQGVGERGMSCRVYDDLEAMLETEDLDAVIIATPPFFQRRYTELAMEAGLHVYCEKPMSNSIADARAMVLAQRRTGKLLQIGYQRRSNPRYVHTRDKLVHGARLLGQMVAAEAHWNRPYVATLPRTVYAGVHSIPEASLARHGYSKGIQGAFEHRNWRFFRHLSSGVLGDLASHQVDVLNWFFGSPPRSVQASGGLDHFKPEAMRAGVVSDIEAAIAKTKSTARLEKLRAELEQTREVSRWRDADCIDNLMAIYEYETPKQRWRRGADKGETLISRASYSLSSMTSSQSFYERFMGENGALAMSELGGFDRVHRESHAPDWERYQMGDEPLLVREKWAEVGQPVPQGGPQSKQGLAVLPFQGSEYWPSYRLPEHTLFYERPCAPHLRNFFEIVARGGAQEDLNCPAEEAFKTLVSVLKIEEAIARRVTVDFAPEDFVVA